MLERNTGHEIVTRDYQNKGGAKAHVLNGSEIVHNMAEQLSKSFANKVAALRRLKLKAEETVRNYQHNSSLTRDDVKYVNMKDFNLSNVNVQYHPKFQQEVSFSTSGVHIPVDIYDGYPEVLNGLKWTEVLDEVFKENNPENDPQLLWQFFGSKVGFMRVYPVNRWKEIPSSIDLYDVRRRPWYIQGSTSSKDMLILMDTSGSVHGQTFAIMKQAVKTLLNTLEENDYVNVAWFSNKAGWASCFDRFVQANSWNKKTFFEGIDALQDGGMSSYSAALEFAFQAFNNFSAEKRDYEGAECHKVVMIFTDGGTDKPEDILEKYNKKKNIRIFTYAVGPHAIPVNAVKWLACENRGYFSTISALGGIRTKIQEYPNVLVRPMALSDGQSETYSTVYTDAGGVGMVITVTLPVYNQSEYSGNQSSVGVVGIDTPVTAIEASLPRQKTGPNSYTFAINRNGFVLLHPKMKPQHVYLADDPDIDFLDLEPDDSQSQNPYFSSLRKDMIDEKTGSQKFLTYINSGDKFHVVLKNVTYHFTPIFNTSMSLGIVMPDDRTGYLSFIRNDKVTNIDVNLAKDGILIAPWEFCSGLNTSSDMATFLNDLNEKLAKDHKSCNEEMINRLDWDIQMTEMVQRLLSVSSFNNKIGKWSAVFIGTEGGLTRFFPKSEEQNVLKIRDPLKVTYYKKALYYPTWTFMLPNEFGQNESSPVVTAVKPITVKMKEVTYQPAVFGVQLFEWAVVDLIRNCQIQIQDQMEPKEPLESYLLDDGGYIIASHLKENAAHAGKFLGEVDPALMLELVNNSVYKRRLEYDYHAICTREEHKVTAASSSHRIPPITALLRAGYHMATDALLWLLMTGWSGAGVTEVDAELEVSLRATNYTCTKQRTLYYFPPVNELEPDTARGMVQCENCTRNYATMRLLKTNLLLVMVTQRDECPFNLCNEKEKFNYLKEEVIVRNLCDEEKQLRYRRRPPPSTCYAFHPREDFSECSSATVVSLAQSLLMIVIALAFIAQRVF
ncbi:Voltage-dependent calcium channel subunit alpha-2/delta-1, variant 2 [Chamberlinius hualienensis]